MGSLLYRSVALLGALEGQLSRFVSQILANRSVFVTLGYFDRVYSTVLRLVLKF